MKKATYENKLAELLGLTEVKQQIDEKKQARQGKIQGISEDEIQEFRVFQGITYFLQAPELFSYKVCKHCGEGYLVSRLYVAFCSYTCIRKSLNELGLEWRKGNDIEVLIQESYDGQEPIWIRNLPKLKAALEYLTGAESSLTPPSPREPLGSLATSSS